MVPLPMWYSHRRTELSDPGPGSTFSGARAHLPPGPDPPMPTRPKITNKQTPATARGGWDDVEHLDRQNVDCANDGAMQQFQLGNVGDESYIEYDYKCAMPLSKMESKTSTNATPFQDLKTVEFLDRHTVECPEGSVLSRFQLQTKGNKNNDGRKVEASYVFSCSTPMEGPRDRRDLHTEPQSWGNHDYRYLDRHNVVCDRNEALQMFQLYRPGDDNLAYKYRCCGLPLR